MRWRVLNSGCGNPAENMAVDEAIMEGVIKGTSLPTIRFYTWNPPTVSCGYNQEVAKEIDLNLVKQNGYGFVRRPTGGRMVLHEDEVTYAVITKCEGRFSGSITDSYSEISKALLAGFLAMGVNVELERGSLSSAHQRQTTNPCFASSSKYELNYQRKKIVGSAQVRKENVLLQHGSILLDQDQSRLALLLPNLEPEQRDKLLQYLAKKTVSINQILSQPVSFSQAVESFMAGFRKNWGNDDFFVAKELEPEEKKKSEKLVESKYLTDDWNLKK
ncbi:MAG TPA: lipoate--protein ligase family protein [Candidatus Cloacimonadota bacterium]|nr:lipoate--protein ligase family protein [Candidatus Cloacimonadota bacterium]